MRDVELMIDDHSKTPTSFPYPELL
jgi:hypothetical protein